MERIVLKDLSPAQLDAWMEELGARLITFRRRGSKATNAT